MRRKSARSTRRKTTSGESTSVSGANKSGILRGRRQRRQERACARSARHFPPPRRPGPQETRHARALPGWPVGAIGTPGHTGGAHAHAAWVAFAGRTVPRRERATGAAAVGSLLRAARLALARAHCCRPSGSSNKLPICQLEPGARKSEIAQRLPLAQPSLPAGPYFRRGYFGGSLREIGARDERPGGVHVSRGEPRGSFLGL